MFKVTVLPSESEGVKEKAVTPRQLADEDGSDQRHPLKGNATGKMAILQTSLKLF